MACGSKDWISAESDNVTAEAVTYIVSEMQIGLPYQILVVSSITSYSLTIEKIVEP